MTKNPFIVGQNVIIVVTTYTPSPEICYQTGNSIWSIWCIPIWYETGRVISVETEEVVVEVVYKYEIKQYIFKPDSYGFTWQHNNHGHNENRLLEDYARLPVNA